MNADILIRKGSAFVLWRVAKDLAVHFSDMQH